MCTQTGRTDMKGRKWATLSSLEKVACGAFSDISFVSAGKKRGFCQLRSKRMQVQKAKRSELNDQSFLARDGVIRRLNILRSLRSPILSSAAGPRGGFGGFSSTLLMRNS